MDLQVKQNENMVALAITKVGMRKGVISLLSSLQNFDPTVPQLGLCLKGTHSHSPQLSASKISLFPYRPEN